jgi:nicotinamidase-related amidase
VLVLIQKDEISLIPLGKGNTIPTQRSGGFGNVTLLGHDAGAEVSAFHSLIPIHPFFTLEVTAMSPYHKLYTPEDSAVVFIDHQPQMTFGVANIDRATLINNVTLLAKVAKEFNVPAVLTAVETESFSGYIWPQLLDVFPGQAVVERTSMNSWDDEGFRKAIEATGRKNIIMTGLWTEVCVTWPTIEMLGAGYNIYVVEDCCGATSQAAHDAALSRMVQAGAVRVTTIPALLEWQRDWAKREHYNNLMGLIKDQGGAYGVGVEYAYTMVHKAPQSAIKPQVVSKKAAH